MLNSAVNISHNKETIMMTPQEVSACVRALADALSPAELAMNIASCNTMTAQQILQALGM